MSPQIIEQTNDMVRRAIVHIRINGRDPVAMNQLYSAIQRRRKARAIRARAQSAHWIKLGL